MCAEPTLRHTFRPAERLKRRKIIGELIGTRRHATIAVHPLRWVFMPLPADAPPSAPAQIAFSVSKKRFKRANQRNRLKRLMRQAWRTQKHLLYRHLQVGQQRWAIIAIWQGAEAVPYEQVHRCTEQLIARFIKRTEVRPPTLPQPPAPPQ